jgi:hypothetical protein
VGETLAQEHARLLRQLEALKLEHRRLEQDIKDTEGHVNHHAKLVAHIADLRAHLAKLEAHIDRIRIEKLLR